MVAYRIRIFEPAHDGVIGQLIVIRHERMPVTKTVVKILLGALQYYLIEFHGLFLLCWKATQLSDFTVDEKSAHSDMIWES